LRLPSSNIFETLDATIGERFASGHLARYPERELLTFVCGEVSAWLARLRETEEQEESDKYVILAAANLVNCIAYANFASANTRAK